ncbi:MAG: peptidase M49 [bacterium]
MDMNKHMVQLFVAAAFTFLWCGGVAFSAPPAQDKGGKADSDLIAERVTACGQDFAVVRLLPDGFDTLSLPDKMQVYYLSEAALSGRDIWYDQNHRDALMIRRILEEILTHPEGTEPAVLNKIALYTKLFWINGGQYNGRTKAKFVPEFTPAELEAAALSAMRQRADFGVPSEESLKDLLGDLGRVIFDANYEPLSVCKDSKKDIVAESAHNYYAPGVTMKDLDNFKEKYQLNSRVAKNGDVIKEDVYRVGGRYSRELERMAAKLEKAVEFVPATDENQKKTLELLIKFFKTGEAKDFEDYNIQWVKTRSNVDMILGFIESYKDPRGVKATFEGLVYYVDQEGTRLMNLLGEKVQYFEGRMPWDKKYCRSNFGSVPSANAVNVALGSGDSGTMPPIGVNLPNDEKLRQTYGSKSVSLSNVLKYYKKVSGEKAKKEFYLPEDRELMLKYGDRAEEVHTAIHEVIGHASGKIYVDDPDGHLKEFARTLEEARAELVALYFASDPALAEKGLFTREEVKKIGEAALKSYATGALTMLRRIDGDEIQDDHMRALQLIDTYLREKAGAFQVVEVNGKTYMKVTDPARMRIEVGELLSRLMEIKSNGDYDQARELVNKYAIKINTTWRDEAKARFKKLDIPPFSALLMPRFELVMDESGAIKDVAWKSDESFTAQELRLSGYSPELIVRALDAKRSGN